jgi:hypothetical protein
LIAATGRCYTTGVFQGTALLGAVLGKVEADIAAGRLVVLLDAYAAPPNDIYAVFVQRKHLPLHVLRVRLWVDFLKQHYQKTPLTGSSIP